MVRASKYFYNFNFKVRYKAGKLNYIFDTLLKLAFVFLLPSLNKKLNTLNNYALITNLIEILFNFKKRMVNSYFKNKL